MGGTRLWNSNGNQLRVDKHAYSSKESCCQPKDLCKRRVGWQETGGSAFDFVSLYYICMYVCVAVTLSKCVCVPFACVFLVCFAVCRSAESVKSYPDKQVEQEYIP